jgi:hypothetical protein
MSIYDNAGVVLIPSGYKAGTTDNLYSVLPANGDGDFNATRGSSATRVNKDGFIESVATNVPRLDYPLIDGAVQDCPALLLEPQRTNIQGYSESFSNWSVANVSVTDNQHVSPDGNLTADFVKEASGVNSKFIYLNESVVSGNDYTYSVFAKSNGTRYIQLTGSVGFGTGHVNFDLQDGIITLESSILDASIAEYPNDWYRITLKLSCTTTTSSGRFLIALIGTANSGRVGTYSGNTSNGVYLWGAQLEISDYPTSYIQNLSSGTTTRSADACNGSGTSAEFNDSEGVLFGEISALANDGTVRRIAIPNTGVSGLHRIELSSTDNRVFGVTYVSPSNQAAISYTMPNATTPFKIAYKYKQNDFSLWVNGFERGTDTSGSVPTGLTKLNFDNGAGGNDFYGKSKQLMAFKTALTDSELETLTSWDSFNAMAKGQLYTIE